MQTPYTLPNLDDGIFLPIQTGKAIHDTDLHIQGDNELNGQPCDNISSKNDYYAELTAVYWAWKNIKKIYPNLKYIGLCHNRRYFAMNERNLLYKVNAFSEAIPKPEAFIKNIRYNAQEIIDILESGRIIIPKPVAYPFCVAAQYCYNHVSRDYRALTDVIQENFSDYATSFRYVMEENHKLSSKIMFIMKWEDFDKYCEWLFPVLAVMETKIPYKDYYGTDQVKVFAYQAERLFYVWQLKNRKKRKPCALYMADDNYYRDHRVKEGILPFLKKMLVQMKVSLGMNIIYLNNHIRFFLRSR